MIRVEERPPSLPHLPLIGNALEFRRDRLRLQLRTTKLGELATFHMGPIPVYMSSSCAVAQEMLVDQADAFHKSKGLVRFAGPVLGEGLLTSEGDKHRSQRKLLAPAFTPKRLVGYAATMVAATEARLGRWQDGATFDVAEEMMALTLDIVGRTLFDADVRGDAREIGKAITESMEYVLWALASPLALLPLSVPLPRHLRVRRAVEELDAIVFRIIADRRREPRDVGDVLSILLAARGDEDGLGMSDRQVRDEAMTLFLAGHETTANALSWTWLQLTQHPEVYTRLLAEVDAVLGRRAATFEDVPRLVYTAQVIKETMRLYPPAYIIGRNTLRDVRFGRYVVPEGSTILFNVFAMHRRADYYAKPDAFVPERFADEKALPRGAYLPFGNGPRVCIGNHFASMEAVLVLATIAQRFRFDLAQSPDIEPEPLLTLRPKGGVAVRLRAREPESARP